MSRDRNISHGSFSKKEMPIKINEGTAKALNAISEMEHVTEAKPVKKEVKELFLFGKIKREFDLAGNKFLMETLTAKTQKDIMFNLAKIPTDQKIYNLKLFILAKSIISVNGESLDSMSDIEDPFEASIDVISNMQSLTVEKLYGFYQSMLEESDKLLNGQEVSTEVKN